MCFDNPFSRRANLEAISFWRSAMKTRLDDTGRKVIGLSTESRVDSNDQTGVDLCINCDEAEHCRLRSNAKEPIFYCEEYQCITSQSTASERRAAAGLAITKPDSSERAPGLCINCSHADTCRLPKSEAGVWYCEEYE